MVFREREEDGVENGPKFVSRELLHSLVKCLCDLDWYERNDKVGGDEVDDNTAPIEQEELLEDRVALDDGGVNKSPG